jgi:endogenous inhibitor of DNA gyrase (YacG/DUF329 family)
VSPLDTETTAQRIEYACPRCEGLVAREDTVCPHCGQQVDLVAAEEQESPVPPADAEAVAAGPVNPLSLPVGSIGEKCDRPHNQ